MSKLGGVDTSILHHVLLLLFIVFLINITLCGAILMHFLSKYARFTQGGRMPAAGILDWKRSKYERPILHNSKSSKNLWRIILEYIKNIGRRRCQRGPTRQPQSWGARPTPLGAPLWLVGPLAGLRCPSSTIWRVLTWKKNHKGAFGTKRHRLEAELGQNQSRAPAELFCRGNFPPGGGNRSHRHHQ